MIIEEYEDYECADCGIKDSQIAFSNMKAWTYQWVRISPYLSSIGKKRWTCGNCLMLLFSGLKSCRVEKRDLNK